MRKIEMARIQLSNEDIAKLDSQQKKRLIMFTLIMRDINFLQRCLIIASNEDANSEPFSSGKNTTIFFYLKTLLSKIHEMRLFLERNRILNQSDNSNLMFREKQKAVMEFFANPKMRNILDFIRNKFGFHYEYQDDVDLAISEALSNLDTYEAWVSTRDSGNEIFKSSNTILLQVIFSEMRKEGYSGSDDDLMKALFDVILCGCRILRDFSLAYITEGLDVEWKYDDTIEIDAPEISSVVFPSIVAGPK